MKHKGLPGTIFRFITGASKKDLSYLDLKNPMLPADMTCIPLAEFQLMSKAFRILHKNMGVLVTDSLMGVHPLFDEFDYYYDAIDRHTYNYPLPGGAISKNLWLALIADRRLNRIRAALERKP